MKKKLLIITILAVTVGGAVFLKNMSVPKNQPEEIFVSASTTAERMDYFASHGWEVEEISEKNVTIPSVFSDEYESYAVIQDKQGLPLRRYTGRNGRIFVYSVKNYSPENRKMFAELIVCDNIAVASLVYSENGSDIRIPVQ